MTITDEQTVL